MHIKVRGGTVSDGSTSLCGTCRWATIARGPRLGNEIVECTEIRANRGRITFPVVQCTDYADRRLPSLRDMEDIAWVLRTDNRHKQIGFVRSRDLKPSERHVLDEDPWR